MNRLAIRKELVNYYIDMHRRSSTPDRVRGNEHGQGGAITDDAPASSEGEAPGDDAKRNPDNRDTQFSFCSFASATSHDCDSRLIATSDTLAAARSTLALDASCHREIATAVTSRPESVFVASTTALSQFREVDATLVHPFGDSFVHEPAPAPSNAVLEGPASKTWHVKPEKTHVSDGDAIAEELPDSGKRAGRYGKKASRTAHENVVTNAGAVDVYGSLRGVNARVYSVNCVLARWNSLTSPTSKTLLVQAPAFRVGMASQVLRRPILAIARKLRPCADSGIVEWVMPIHPSVDGLVAALPHWSRMVTLARSKRKAANMEYSFPDSSEPASEFAQAACSTVHIGSIGAKLSLGATRSLSAILLRSGYRGSADAFVRCISRQLHLRGMNSRISALSSTQATTALSSTTAEAFSTLHHVVRVQMALPARLALLQITIGPMRENYRTYIRRPSAERRDPIFAESAVDRQNTPSTRLLARAVQRQRPTRLRANSASRFAA